MNKMDDTQLRAAVSRNELLADWGGYAVVLGLVMEVALAWAFPAGGASAIEHWGTVGTDVLVAAGVAAEILFSRRARAKAEELQKETDLKIAEAELRTEQLRSQIAWRRLSSAAIKAMSETLASFPKMSVKLAYPADDPEARTFAQDIRKVFKANGWCVGAVAGSSFSGEIVLGIRIPRYPPPDLDACEVVRAAFSKAQIEFTGGSVPFFHMGAGEGENVTSPCADLYVGPKPTPTVG